MWFQFVSFVSHHLLCSNTQQLINICWLSWMNRWQILQVWKMWVKCLPPWNWCSTTFSPQPRRVFQHYKPETFFLCLLEFYIPLGRQPCRIWANLVSHPPSWPHCLFLPHSSLLVSLPRAPLPSDLHVPGSFLPFRSQFKVMRLNLSSFSPLPHSLLWAHPGVCLALVATWHYLNWQTF